MSPPASRRLRHGFSLVEMLITMTAVGIIAAIAIAYMGGINVTAKDAKNRRNAQEIASMSMAASAAGTEFVVIGDEEATIRKLVDGVEAKSGVFKGRVFSVPGLTTEDIKGAMEYLELRDNDLDFTYNNEPTRTLTP